MRAVGISSGLLWLFMVVVLLHQQHPSAAYPRPDLAHGLGDPANGTVSQDILDNWHSHGWRVYGGGELEINPLRTDPRYLRSRLFEDPAAGPTCLRFQYWLSAPGHSRLTVTVHGAGATGGQVWHALATEAASVWHSTAVNITTVGGPFWVEITGQKNVWNDCIRLRNIQLLTSVCSPEVLSKLDMTAATSTESLPTSLTTNTSVQVKTTTAASVKTTRMRMSTTTSVKTTAKTTTTITPSQEASRTTTTTTTSSTVKAGTDVVPTAARLEWTARGWRQDARSGIKEIEDLRTRPATLTSKTLSPTGATPHCLHFRYLLTSQHSQLTVALREDGGTERMLWDSRNQSVSSAVLWRAKDLNFTTGQQYRVEINGRKLFWNDRVSIAALQLLPTPCPQRSTLIANATTTALRPSSTSRATAGNTAAGTKLTTVDAATAPVVSATLAKPLPNATEPTAVVAVAPSSSLPSLKTTRTPTTTTTPASLSSSTSSISSSSSSPGTATATPTAVLAVTPSSSLPSLRTTRTPTTTTPLSTLSSTISSFSSSSSSPGTATATPAAWVAATERKSSEISDGTVVGVVTAVLLVIAVVVVIFVYRRGYYVVCFKYLRFQDDQESLEVSFRNNPLYDVYQTDAACQTGPAVVGVQESSINHHRTPNNHDPRENTVVPVAKQTMTNPTLAGEPMGDNSADIEEDQYEVIELSLHPHFEAADDSSADARMRGFRLVPVHAGVDGDNRGAASMQSHVGYADSTYRQGEEGRGSSEV